MNTSLQVSAENDCASFLKNLQSMGVLVGDFYLLLGRAWEAPAQKPFEYRMGPKKQCYRNACLLAQEHPELVYCEGFACAPGLFAMHHAWCVTATGLVVDPTWDASSAQYYGVALQHEFVLERVDASQHWGVLGDRISSDIARMPASAIIHPDWQNSIEDQLAWRDLVQSKLGPSTPEPSPELPPQE